MNQTQDGSYVIDYTQTWWFPLNGKGYGKREGLYIFNEPIQGQFNPYPTNFWFTLQIDITFYYRSKYSLVTPADKVSLHIFIDTTDVFNFLGDDDLYIFITTNNGTQLACDVGGIHQPAPCNIALSAYPLTLGNLYTMNVFCRSNMSRMTPRADV